MQIVFFLGALLHDKHAKIESNCTTLYDTESDWNILSTKITFQSKSLFHWSRRIFLTWASVSLFLWSARKIFSLLKVRSQSTLVIGAFEKRMGTEGSVPSKSTSFPFRAAAYCSSILKPGLLESTFLNFGVNGSRTSYSLTSWTIFKL